MRVVSIANELTATPPQWSKNYLCGYAECGYELGVGRAGSFSGHSHLFFADIVFSPHRIHCQGRLDLGATITLLVVPPRTYMPSVRIGDFFFLKFCPDSRKVVLPDKVTTHLAEGSLGGHSDRVDIHWQLYDHEDSMASPVTIILRGEHLRIDIGGKEPISVVR